MRVITFYKTSRAGPLLHVETEGCIVNIRVGLSDLKGREVTSVQVLPDQGWKRVGLCNTRVIKLKKGG